MSWAVWITGPPGSGKTTLARAAAAALASQGVAAKVLELDEIRKTLTPEPTYTDVERDVVYRALAYMAKLLTEVGVPVILDATAHRRAWRELARRLIPVFAEVQLLCPLEVCRGREETRHARHAPRGIYAHGGQAGATVPGVDLPYERAVAPELELKTDEGDVATAVRRIVSLTERLRQRAGASSSATT